MKRSEFIKVMESKGYIYRFVNNNTYLNQGVAVMEIQEDDSLHVSNPSGNFEYKTFDDYFNGNVICTKEYIIKDEY